MLLMRSRGEAELARMMTEIEKLQKLHRILASSKKPNLLPCFVGEDGTHKKLIVRNLHYTRGTASARADHLELDPGAYALTGSNGSGKSTLFRIFMSCRSNEKSIDLHSSINLLTPMEPLTEEDDLLRERACLRFDDNDDEATLDESCASDLDGNSRDLTQSQEANVHIPRLSIVMPSRHVVEISQNFYWPLYSRPIDWIYQDFDGTESSIDIDTRVRRVAEELHSLQFFQSGQNGRKQNNTTVIDAEIDDLAKSSDATSSEATINRIMAELREEKEDWFSDLSGGQKSKVELVRTLFLRDHCPDVLLVDETMAPLDPASKELVMAKLKLFCNESIIIVIYHTDVGQGKDVEGTWVDCVPSTDFFDSNIHLDKGIVHLRPCCK
jgi:energy-coupling factor transporter ATP-binding protein EcfA2